MTNMTLNNSATGGVSAATTSLIYDEMKFEELPKSNSTCLMTGFGMSFDSRQSERCIRMLYNAYRLQIIKGKKLRGRLRGAKSRSLQL